MNKIPAERKEQVKVDAEADRKESENKAATTLSPNLNQAVEKSIAKSSKDEAKTRPE